MKYLICRKIANTIGIEKSLITEKDDRFANVLCTNQCYCNCIDMVTINAFGTKNLQICFHFSAWNTKNFIKKQMRLPETAVLAWFNLVANSSNLSDISVMFLRSAEFCWVQSGEVTISDCISAKLHHENAVLQTSNFVRKK